MNRGLSLWHGSRRRMSRVDKQTLSPGWYGGADRQWASAWVLCLRTACWSWTCAESQTLSLSLNQKSTAGTSDSCPSQGNKEGWYPSTHWKGVRDQWSVDEVNSVRTRPREGNGSSRVGSGGRNSKLADGSKSRVKKLRTPSNLPLFFCFLLFLPLRFDTAF